MNIGINASSIGSVKGGASFYMVNVIQSLIKLNSEHTFYIFCSKRSEKYFSSFENDKIVILPIVTSKVSLRLLWEQTVLPLYLCKKYKINSLFSPNYTSPLITHGFKSVVTIHDLSFFPLSKLYPFSRRLFKPIIKLSCIFANHIIAVSKHTQKDISKYIGKFDNKTSVVYNAVNERFNKTYDDSKINTVKKKYEIDSDYILFTGFLEPRKNLHRLIDAYLSICSDIPHKLVITGGNGWWFEDTYTKVENTKLRDRIIFTGYVEDDELPLLFAGATLFAFPSLYEGFGIAALEAISMGTPVLASNNSALPEVVQNAGVLVDPFDSNDISSKLKDLLTDKKKIKKLKSNCPNVSKQFSWTKAAKETLQILVN